MIPSHIKQRVCKYLFESKSLDALEELKRVSKGWCFQVLALQWGEYIIRRGPKWFLDNEHNYSCGPNVYMPKEPFADFFDYGHYFVKHIKLNVINTQEDLQFYKAKCPNLNSLALVCYSRPSIIKDFIKLNPLIKKLHMTFYFNWGIPVDISEILSLNLQQLRKLEIYYIRVSLPTIPALLDQLPNLREVKI
jgi:hypothetical protein